MAAPPPNAAARCRACTCQSQSQPHSPTVTVFHFLLTPSYSRILYLPIPFSSRVRNTRWMAPSCRAQAGSDGRGVEGQRTSGSLPWAADRLCMLASQQCLEGEWQAASTSACHGWPFEAHTHTNTHSLALTYTHIHSHTLNSNSQHTWLARQEHALMSQQLPSCPWQMSEASTSPGAGDGQQQGAKV